MPGSGKWKINAEVSFDSPKGTLTVFFEEYKYMVGAHPNSEQLFHALIALREKFFVS